MRRLIPFLRNRQSQDRAPAPALERTAGRTGRPRLRMAIVGVLSVTVISLAGTGYAQRASLGAALIEVSAESGLQLQKIEVHGRAHTPKDVLLAAAELSLGDPMLGISLPELHSRLLAIGWIEQVAVERRMPTTIRIVLNERIPMALLQTVNGHRVIDSSGTIIAGADPAAFAHLTVVAGTQAADNAAPILDILKTEPELFADVWAVTFQSERRWDVHLRNGIRVRLPETDPRTAWSRLAMIDHSKQITNRDLAVIDMRVPDQMIVEPNIPVRGKGRET